MRREGSAQVVGCLTQNEASFGLFRFNRKPSVFNPKNQLLNGFQIWKLKLNLKPEKTDFLVRFDFFGSVFGFRFGFAHGEIEWMSITKCRDFANQLSQKLTFSFPQKAFQSYQFVKLGATKAILESELVRSVRPRHSSVSPRLLGFH